MPTAISETTLPNGMEIFCLQPEEVEFLYTDVQSYLSNGIELHPGDTVFDVGANIGLFTLWVNQTCNNNVNIYAFEPIPVIFEVLKANVKRWNPEKIKVLDCGLAESSKTITFVYYPNATFRSRLAQDSAGEQEDKDHVKYMFMNNTKDALKSVRWLRWLPPFLREILVDKKIENMFETEEVTCQLKTISEIIREQDIPQIDLLKIDAEKCELDVILGIEEQDWPKIKQVVAEVHDLDSRVEKMTALLKENGFSKITVEQEPMFQGSTVCNLYALR